MKTLYFHGFDSSREKSTTYKALKEILGSVDCYSIDYTKENVTESEKIENIKQYNVLIGNSFGGFPALYFGLKERIPFMLINPAVNPTEVLLKHGIKSVLYKNSEKQLKQMIDEELEKNRVKKTIIISKNDDVVDNSIILNTGLTEISTFIETEWTHRIPKDGIPMIAEELKRLAD
ncbi:YqiA/YcfP family alpha/beta fold hydrolase [Flexistipes sp.]|uniref:YqiA/YcfP family alpha/beta fold hydrolase n=1 Tax=Flexistipes sp. TaxID=3088135 RepID=UPI002E1C97F9|nr:YqiA/YcfP family alpha/beta fold hydrolase [Flexistipes sp.]